MQLDVSRSRAEPGRARGCVGCLPAVFGTLFFGAGVVFLHFTLLLPLLGIMQARDWVPTKCTVVSSRLKAGGGDGDTSGLEVVYRYKYGGADYQSDRYCFVSMSSNTSRTWKRQVLREHPAGKETQCYVDPKNPAQAVIERGWVPEMWWGLFSLPFLAVGIGAMLLGPSIVRSNTRRREGFSDWRPDTSAESRPAATDYGNFGRAAGLVTLKPESTPLTGCLVALFIALFWNGIVSMFVWQAIEAFRHGPGFGDWFVALFLTPFVAVGLVLVCVVLYSFLTIFNPRPTLTVNSMSVPLGGTLDVRWTLWGRVHSISHFKIVLRGVEKAEYMRGTSKHIDTETFAEIAIFETFDTLQMIQGEARLAIPTHTMHSFAANHNKIEWSLEVRGDISFWPNLSALFPIVLLPLPIQPQR